MPVSLSTLATAKKCMNTMAGQSRPSYHLYRTTSIVRAHDAGTMNE